jgi:hypothetical protein
VAAEGRVGLPPSRRLCLLSRASFGFALACFGRPPLLLGAHLLLALLFLLLPHLLASPQLRIPLPREPLPLLLRTLTRLLLALLLSLPLCRRLPRALLLALLFLLLPLLLLADLTLYVGRLPVWRFLPPLALDRFPLLPLEFPNIFVLKLLPRFVGLFIDLALLLLALVLKLALVLFAFLFAVSTFALIGTQKQRRGKHQQR